MATLRSAPGAWLSDTYKRPWRDGNHTSVVEMEPPAGGEWKIGTFKMPRRLADAKPDTNDWLIAQRWIRDSMDRWGQWLERRGWYAVTKLEHLGNRDVPTPNPQTPTDEEMVQVYVRGRFTRRTPLYMSTDSFDAIRDVALRWGLAEDTKESLRFEHLPAVEEPAGWVKDNATVVATPHNPAKLAYERQRQQGKTQKDYLIGSDPRKPLGEEKIT